MVVVVDVLGLPVYFGWGGGDLSQWGCGVTPKPRGRGLYPGRTDVIGDAAFLIGGKNVECPVDVGMKYIYIMYIIIYLYFIVLLIHSYPQQQGKKNKK